jgi:hypothetical protein
LKKYLELAKRKYRVTGGHVEPMAGSLPEKLVVEIRQLLSKPVFTAEG